MSKQAITKIIAEMSVQVDGKLPRIYTAERARRGVESADTPARLLLPSTEGDEHIVESGGSGGTMEVVWVIKDLLLFRPVEEGMGWLEVGYALDDYCDSYIAAVASVNNDTTKLCGIGATLRNASMLVGVQTFASREYYGVMVTLRIANYI